MVLICPRQVLEETAAAATAAAAAKPVTIGRGTAKIIENCRNSSPRHRTARHLYPHTVTANAALTITVHANKKSRTTQKG